MTIQISLEFKPLLPPLPPEDYNQLEQNILADGCREPLVLFNGVLVDGHNRYEICTKHNLPFNTVEMDFPDNFEAKLWMIKNQSGRRNLTDGWQYQLKRVRKEILQEQGRVKLSEAGKIGAEITNNTLHGRPLSTIDKPRKEYHGKDCPECGHSCWQTDENCPKCDFDFMADYRNNFMDESFDDAIPVHNTREIIANELGWSTGKVAMADKVWKEANPWVIEQVLSNNISINEAYTTIKTEKKAKNRVDVVNKIIEISQGNESFEGLGKFPVIYADPPWRYEFSKTENREIENHYPTMTLDDICAMDINDISTDDSILFMWATSPKLEEAFKVIKAWGFSYVTCAVWDKEKIGMGYYFRQQHELLLVAKKGAIPAPIPSARVSSVLRFKRGDHSSKPEELYKIIEDMYPEYKKLELFCRTPREGWAVWGNQANG
jgi:N6-adenosine-specific RNA methylase IME4